MKLLDYKTRQINVGGIRIGGGAPIVIQSMTKTDTRDVVSTVKQIRRLEEAGCQIVRVAVRDLEAARAIKALKKNVKIPLVADIHFDYRLALEAIKNGADKIRLNPGNIYKKEEIREVIGLAKKRHIPIRVGVNSGSIGMNEGGIVSSSCRRDSGDTVDRMVQSAIKYIKGLEREDFYDIIVSLKSSDVSETIRAYRLFAEKSDCPLHLGITAAGSFEVGVVKSSIGIGILLFEGIGDTIRVSLTGDPCEEVIVAKNILQALRLRYFRPDIISCPICGRCQVDLEKIVGEINSRLKSESPGKKKAIKIAIMGCEVNGPGEAKEADIGIAFGRGTGVLFKNGKIIKRVNEKEAIDEILKYT